MHTNEVIPLASKGDQIATQGTIYRVSLSYIVLYNSNYIAGEYLYVIGELYFANSVETHPVDFKALMMTPKLLGQNPKRWSVIKSIKGTG